jgi:hypothetical protein
MTNEIYKTIKIKGIKVECIDETDGFTLDINDQKYYYDNISMGIDKIINGEKYFHTIEEIMSVTNFDLPETYHLTSGGWSEKITAKNIQEARDIADNRIGYNQEDMKDMNILDEDGNLICYRYWSQTLGGLEDQEDAIEYGTFGYYTDWTDAGA